MLRSPGLNQNTILPARTLRLRHLDPSTLAEWLEPLTPHLGTDPTLAFLGNVHVRIGGGRVHAFATDRYTGAITTLPYPVPGERARFTIPGAFARQAAEALRAEHLEMHERPEAADLTITPRIFALTIHAPTGYQQTEPGTWAWYDQPRTVRLAVRIDPDADTLNLPRVAADALAAPSDPEPVNVSCELLARFLTPGVVAPLDPTSGHLLARRENLLTGYQVHSTGSIVTLARPGYLGFISTCRRADNHAETSPAPAVAEAHAAWRATLAAIA